MTDLDLHPAAEVVPEEVGGDRVEHVHLVRLERHGLLVKVVPARKVRQMSLSAAVPLRLHYYCQIGREGKPIITKAFHPSRAFDGLSIGARFFPRFEKLDNSNSLLASVEKSS